MMTTAALLAAALLLLQAGAARASSADCAVPGCLACATDAAGKDDPTRCDTCDRQLGYFTIAAVDGTCTCNADGGFGLADPADPAQGCACNQPGFAMDAAQKYCVPLCQLAVPGCTTCADGDASACSACDTMAGYAQDAVDGGCTCDASAGYAPADADDPSKGCACTQPGWRTDADGWCVEGKPGEPPCADCEPSNDSKPVHQPPKPRHHGRPGETRCQRRFPGCARCDKLAKRCLRCGEGLRLTGGRCVRPRPHRHHGKPARKTCKHADRHCAACSKRRPLQCAACKRGFRFDRRRRCVRVARYGKKH